MAPFRIISTNRFAKPVHFIILRIYASWLAYILWRFEPYFLFLNMTPKKLNSDGK
jgi:hypothetical protein